MNKTIKFIGRFFSYFNFSFIYFYSTGRQCRKWLNWTSCRNRNWLHNLIKKNQLLRKEKDKDDMKNRNKKEDKIKL